MASLGHHRFHSQSHKHTVSLNNIEIDNGGGQTKNESRYQRMSSSKMLALLFLFTSCIHIGIIVIISTVEFKYPITIFESKLRSDSSQCNIQIPDIFGNISLLGGLTLPEPPSVVEAWKCVYDYGTYGVNNTNYYCNSDDAVEGGSRKTPTKECEFIIQAEPLNNLDTDLGPWAQAYELTEFLAGNDGATLAKVLLISIEGITAISDIIKALFFWFASDDRMKRLISTGTLPLQWREYAITTAMISFFMASISQVHDIFYLIAAALSQFALMFFGYIIEILFWSGKNDIAMILFWLPGMALFSIPWIAIVRNIMNLSVVLCMDPSETNIFTCEKSCFGKDYDFVTFGGVAFLVFAAFPSVPLYASFRLSKRADDWLGKYVKNPLALFLGFLVYIPFSGLRVLYQSLLGFSIPAEQTSNFDDDFKRRLFLQSQTLYAILSFTSKSFITLFFLVVFSYDYPWNDIRAVV